MSDDGSTIIRESNFVPLTAAIRSRIHSVLDLMESRGQRISKYFNADLNPVYITQIVYSLTALSFIMIMGLFASFSKILDSSVAAYLSQVLFYYLFVYTCFITIYYSSIIFYVGFLVEFCMIC